MSDNQESIIVETRTVSCDGCDPETGHPTVYLKIEEKNEVTCPWCGTHYVLAEGAGNGHH